METKDSLTNYYEGYDEEGRLISKDGMVEYITTMREAADKMDDQMYKLYLKYHLAIKQ